MEIHLVMTILIKHTEIFSAECCYGEEIHGNIATSEPKAMHTGTSSLHFFVGVGQQLVCQQCLRDQASSGSLKKAVISFQKSEI